MILMLRFLIVQSPKAKKKKKKNPRFKTLWAQAFPTRTTQPMFWCVSFQLFLSALIVGFVFIKRQLCWLI